MDDKAEGILLTIIADVFEVIPPENPSVWAQKGSCVPVSVSYDCEKNLYRIMCVHESRCIVNSYITTDTQFMIRTGLFGTWFDIERNATFGIGFRKLSSLHDFSYAFTKAKKHSRDTLAKIIERIDNNNARKSNVQADNKESLIRCEENDSAISEENEQPPEAESSFSQDEIYNLLGSYPGKRTYRGNNESCPIMNNNEATDMSRGDKNHNVVVTFHAEIMSNEASALAQENDFLHKELLESSKILTGWQSQLDTEKQRNETLLKANENYVSKMDELARKEKEFNIQADHWKDRYDNSEAIRVQASEDMMIKYEQDIEDALNSKEFFEKLVANQDSQIKELKTRIADYNQDVEKVQNENDLLKQQYKSTYDKTQELVQGATDQWQTMRDIEKNISKGAEKLIEVYDGIKRLVKRGAGSWKYDNDPEISS